MMEGSVVNNAILRQVLLAVFSSLGFLATGLIRGFSSPGVPSMEIISPHIVPNQEALSWIMSVPPLGAFIGSLVAMPWMHFMGRKTVLQMIGPIFALSWVLIGVSDSTFWVSFFRACTGFGAGVSLPAAQVYVSECSKPEVRGIMSSLPSVVMAGGILIQYLFGFAFDWRGMSFASAVFPAALLPVLIPFPESPSWLRLNGKDDKKSSRWYGIGTPVQEEDTATLKEGLVPKTTFCSRGVLIPLFLAFAIIFFQQSCGNDVVLFNAVSIFRSSNSSVDDYTASLIVALVHFIFVLFSVTLIDKFGRKRLLVFSAAVMGLSIGCLSFYFNLLDKGKTEGLNSLPLASLIVYIAAFSLGFCTVPMILVGEIFPLAYRSLLGPLTTSIGLLSMFIELKTYSYFVNYLGKDGTFAVYSFMNFVAVVFVYFLLPETKGKSLDEIEKYFNRSNERNKAIEL